MNDDAHRDLSRINSGVYRLVSPGHKGCRRVVSGKLCHVMSLAKSNSQESIVEYLQGGKWRKVDADLYEHYHGEQQKRLLHWFYLLKLPKSTAGEKCFGNITGLSLGRVHDAMRSPTSKHYTPFTDAAMQYLDYMVMSHLESLK